MSTHIDVLHPWVLLLLPLALLPLLPLRHARREALGFAHLGWLPADRAGRWYGALVTAAAVVAMGALVLGLAGLGRPQYQIERMGHGAEVLILMDRSRSMDDRMLPDDWRTIDPLRLQQQVWSRGPVKSQVARDLLARFVAQRADDRFALMFFSSNPLYVVPFTQHTEVVQAGINAGGVGRGLSETDMGRALIAAIDQFEHRAYTGSRLILLVSDGGTWLADDQRARIAAGLLRNRVALSFLYLRSYNGHTLDDASANAESIPEVALHHFFQGLRSPYHAYQAEVPEEFARAVAEVAAQQNLPLMSWETIPRHALQKPLFAVAAGACAALIALRAAFLARWI